MAAARQRRKNSSSDSSDDGLSSDEEAPKTKLGLSNGNKEIELTLKDDENTIKYQAPLPDEEGKSR